MVTNCNKRSLNVTKDFHVSVLMDAIDASGQMLTWRSTQWACHVNFDNPSYQNTCKMHVVWILFGHLHKRFNSSLIWFLHINQHLMVTFNVFHRIQVFFSASMALVNVSCSASCWVVASCFSPKHFFGM